jgi:hypothetical protein
MHSLATLLFLFATKMQLERVQGGILRLKHPSELRPGLRRLPAWPFWLQFLGGSVAKYARMIATYVRVARWRRAVERDLEAHAYMDQALSPVGDQEEEEHTLAGASPPSLTPGRWLAANGPYLQQRVTRTRTSSGASSWGCLTATVGIRQKQPLAAARMSRIPIQCHRCLHTPCPAGGPTSITACWA